MPRFADVILPAAVPGVFTYALTDELGPVLPGMRIVVPFGAGRKLYGGLVTRVHDVRPEGRNVRPALSVLDATPLLEPVHLQLWQRLADHYLCSLGEVMLAALPGPMVLTSETRVTATALTAEHAARTPRAALLLDALEQRPAITLGEAGELLQVKDPLRAMKQLLDDGAVALEEELRSRPVERLVRHVALTPEAADEASLHAWFDRLARAPRQLALLMKGIELGRWLDNGGGPVAETRLLKAAGAERRHVEELVRKGLFIVTERPADRPPARPGSGSPTLSPAQALCLEEMDAALKDHRCCLLQGVTGSGKTEVYAHLIERAVDQGGQVLYLLPEIALTTQLIVRLRTRFGDRVSVFHSRLTARQRADLWSGILRDPDAHPIVVGARSALFLPFRHLRLIIVDEEHDPSYKQQDPSPRYNARDMAVVLGELMEAPVVLGSATPSMETLYNARQGKYGHARLLERFGDSVLPSVELIDLREAYKRKRMQGHFTPELLEAVQRTVERRDQVILFQNRRGYAPVWQCEQCAHVPNCAHCDVSLTYHKRSHELRCHYCGRGYPPPTACPSCGSRRLKMIGLGTERIEEELAVALPDVRVARLDQDTARGKHALERLMHDFAEGRIDVLVGTQMVTKGLDMERVNTVGILSADRLLRFPDFRAHERAFQLMGQVAGRSGRRGVQGRVLIQAFDVAHPVLGHVLTHDVDGFYARELEHRQAHGYPPFSRLVRFTLKHRSEERVEQAARTLVDLLRPDLGDRVLGPETPAVAWVRDQHIRNVLVKLARGIYGREKQVVRAALDRLPDELPEGRVRLIVDVDPG
ncbi:MAG: primosomal protein N' [Flavobacteriales bacterium]|nr:primosomal protein N' [Flavobacteriales bacterium]